VVNFSSEENNVIFSPPVIIFAVVAGILSTRINFFLIAFLIADLVVTVLKIPTAYSCILIGVFCSLAIWVYKRCI